MDVDVWGFAIGCRVADSHRSVPAAEGPK